MRELLRAGFGTKAENRSKVIRAVMAKPGTQTEIARRASLSNATVSEVVRELRKESIFTGRSAGKQDSLALAEVSGVAVGIELGFQYTIVVARRVDQSHSLAREARIHLGATATRATNWVDELVERTLQLVREVGDAETDLATIGLGVPRMVNPRASVFTPPLLPPWDSGRNPVELIGTRLRESLGDATPPVLMDNDANLGALGEFTLTHPDKETLVYIKASTGIGAGIMLDGKILRGRRGVAGEIGHTRAEANGKFCLCGGRGCLETVIGADALVEAASTGLGHKPVHPPQDLEELISKAKSGNAVCRRVLVEAAGVLGVAIGNVCNLINPDVVVIGGALGRIDAEHCVNDEGMIIGPCLAAVRQTALYAAHAQDFKLESSRVEPAVAHGALIMGLLGTRYGQQAAPAAAP